MSRDWFEGWPGQYRRMLRWRDRVTPLLIMHDAVDGNTLYDFTYAFFQSSYHLRDWLLAAGATGKPSLNTLFDASVELQLCRDICNATKHLQYDRPSIDPRPRISREFDPWSQGAGEWYVYADERRPLGELIHACVNAWNVFLEREGLISAIG